MKKLVHSRIWPSVAARPRPRSLSPCAGVILMQVLPFVDQKCLEAFAGFERGVYAGLDAAGQKAA
jgi:hypothetical protein